MKKKLNPFYQAGPVKGGLRFAKRIRKNNKAEMFKLICEWDSCGLPQDFLFSMGCPADTVQRIKTAKGLQTN